MARIGIDGRLWSETGVGRYLRSLFRYLPRDQELVWFFGKKEFETIEMPPKWKKVLADVHWHTLAEQLILPLVFLKENLDLLHFPYFTFPILYPKRFVVTIHDLIYDHYKTGKGSTLVWPLFLIKKLGYLLVNVVSIRRASKILTLSNDAKNEIVAHYGANPEKIFVTYESGTLEDNSKPGPAPTRKPYLLYVGNAHPHKNVESLIKAIEILNADRHSGDPAAAGDSRIDSGHGQNDRRIIRLVLVGNDKFFYPRLPKSKWVEVVGEVPNKQIADWYRHAEALVTASKMEGFGIPPLEAMSVGCPAIVSDIPVFREVYGDAAVYFDQNDPKDIARVIEGTLRDKKKLLSQITLGYKQAEKYRWEKMVRETLSAYESCLSLRSG